MATKKKTAAGQASVFAFSAPKSKAKKSSAKKSTKKTTKKTAKKLTPLMRVRKLVSEGRVKSGFVSRLGVRKQTPPPPKSKKADRKRRALNAGYRVSKSGNLYYESRENRSDTPHGKPRRGRKAPAKRGRK